MDSGLLEIRPGELNFTFELKKQNSCSIQLSNKTNQYVAFKVKTTSPKKYCVRPNVGIVKPKSACDFTVTMQAQCVAPPDLHCKDKFLILSTVVAFGTIDEDITSDMFSKDSGKYIEERKLKVILVSPPQSPVLLPIKEELRKDLHDETWVQKDKIHNGPPHSGDLKQEPNHETSAQRESVISGLSGNGDVKQDLTFENYVQKYKFTNGSPNNEKLSLYESYEESVQEEKVLNGKFEEMHQKSNYESLAAKSSLYSGFAIAKEPEEDHPSEVLSYDILAKKDSSGNGLEISKEPLKDLACEISLERDESLSRLTNMDSRKGRDTEADVEDITSSIKAIEGMGGTETVDQEELSATKDVKVPDIVGEAELIAAKDLETDIVDELKGAKFEESSSIDDVEEVKPVKAFVGWDLAKEFKGLQSELSAGKHIESSLVDGLGDPKAVKDVAGLDLTKELGDLKSKFSLVDSKLKEAEMTIAKLTEERSMSTRDKDMLTRELEVLRKKNTGRKIQVGFPLLYVCMVALVSLVLGYISHA